MAASTFSDSSQERILHYTLCLHGPPSTAQRGHAGKRGSVPHGTLGPRKENEMASAQACSRGGGRERVHVDGMTMAPAGTLGYGREMNETTVRNVSQVLNMPTDRVCGGRFGPAC
jgi:hypothetical protein